MSNFHNGTCKSSFQIPIVYLFLYVCEGFSIVNVMTSSRVIRGTKAKLFLYGCAILVITGLIACYSSTLSQLDDIRKSNEICHQQEENLSTQLQVISDYKQRLEKSLKTEKVEHQQTKTELENKLNEEKNKNEQITAEFDRKYNSLQQHCNLLQTQHDDYEEVCSKTKQTQQEEINNLQAKLKEMREEIKKIESSKASLKSEYDEVLKENKHLNEQLGNKSSEHVKCEELRHDYALLKQKCSGTESNLPDSESTTPKKSFSPSQDMIQGVNKLDTNVLNVPPAAASVSSSSSKPSVKPSRANLDGARPLLQPVVSPSNKKVSVEANLPDGVVAKPKLNEYVKETVINDNGINVDKGNNDIEKENAGGEMFDGLGFGENDMEKQKPNLDKKHIDAMGVIDSNNKKQYDQDYKENEAHLDDDDYNLGRPEDPGAGI